MKKDYSIEDYYVGKLREARSKYEGKDIHGDNADMPLCTALREYITGNISPALRSLSQETLLKCASVGTEGGTGLMYPLETRAISVTDTKGVTITEDIFDLLGAIRNNLVLVKAGARLLTGLKGNVSFAAYSGSSVKWAGETEAASDGKGDFTRQTLAPKRLTAYVDISQQMLLQNSIDVDKYIMNDFAKAIASALQAAILGAHEHSSTKPDGIFTSADLCITGSADFKKIISMQSEVYDTALNYCYLTNNAGFAKLKGTLKVSDVAEGFIIDHYDDEPLINYCSNYPIYRTNDVPEISGEHGIAFGDFSELVIGQWGDLDITVDPYTKATNGMIRLVVNTWFDAVVRRANAIAVGSFL